MAVNDTPMFLHACVRFRMRNSQFVPWANIHVVGSAGPSCADPGHTGVVSTFALAAGEVLVGAGMSCTSQGTNPDTMDVVTGPGGRLSCGVMSGRAGLSGTGSANAAIPSPTDPCSTASPVTGVSFSPWLACQCRFVR